MKLRLVESYPGEARAPGAGGKLAKALCGMAEVAARDLPEAEADLVKAHVHAPLPLLPADGAARVFDDLADHMAGLYRERLTELQREVIAAVTR